MQSSQKHLAALGRLSVTEVSNIVWVPLLLIGVFFLLLPCHFHAFKGDFEAGKRRGGMRGEAREFPLLISLEDNQTLTRKLSGRLSVIFRNKS